MTTERLTELMLRSSNHVAPPKVTITRPSTATSVAVGVRKSSEIIPASGTQPHDQHHGPSKKKLSCPAPATIRISTSHFAAPTRPPPPVRPKSSSVSAPSRSGPPSGSQHTATASPRSGAIRSTRRHEVSLEITKIPISTTETLSSSTQASSSSADATGNIYHTMAARKSAEDTAKQLARRIAHFRAQEERVLREVQEVKSKLESDLLVAQGRQQKAQQHHFSSEEECEWPTIDYPGPHRPLRGDWVVQTSENHLGAPSHAKQARKEPKVPRSREQLQFLTKQKKVLQMRKLEAAKYQKEKRKLTLEKQKLKEEADKLSKVVQKEKIRQEYQRALGVRVAKQHQLLENLEGQHDERLQIEKEREHRALGLIEQLREEEKHIALRLQALKFHQEFIKSNLSEARPPSP